MKNLLFIFVLSVFCFNAEAKDCHFGTVTFDSDFPTARLSDCKRKSSKAYVLNIKAENYPINSSPWYAFKVTSKKKQTIAITMKFEDAKSRYLPKVSEDGKQWKQIAYKVQNDKLKFNLKVSKNTIWVAGQEIIGNEFYSEWLEALAANTDGEMSLLGSSTLNRPIYSLEATNDSNEWVVLMGRMHPPEITGALALFPFTEKLLSNSELAKEFRQRFNILLVPNLNPDGVAAGNWRHNSQGVDLNRDWKNIKQKETQLVHNRIQSIIAKGGKLVYAIDFHSTWKEIFYSMPTDYGLKPATITEDWLGLLDTNLPDFEVIIRPGNNPDKGVFKQYIADNYGVHAITYEMGDNTDRKKIKQIAKEAANTFMQTLLSKDKAEF